MGISLSTQTSKEGEHYAYIINPSSKPKNPSSEGGENRKLPAAVQINPRAQIIKNISYELLWNNFLDSPASSFALTQSEMTGLLLDSILINNDGQALTKEQIDSDVKSYINLIAELQEKDTANKNVDFMAVLSSVLLLSPISLELKVDTLFQWIILRDDSLYEFNFDEFFVAMSSFEKGISHALGLVACSETYVRTVATQWMALADPKHKGSADASTKISAKNFFDFCTNRQHVVRRMLEAFGQSEILSDGNLELQEVSDTLDLLKEPSGGDEWMANPAWKKTAERMVTPAAKAEAAQLNTKPVSTLELEWVHGYRGFDCRNNVYYGDQEGTEFLFSAAALGCCQKGRNQYYFGEHGDDIVCMTALVPSDKFSGGHTIIASGELGKSPAIYLYKWCSDDAPQFHSLCCMRGYHTKAVSQLAFSSNGKLLFSVGIEYTVAIHCVDEHDTNKKFGKMLTSSQGPKGKVLHCCYYPESGSVPKPRFISCGEKHAVLWTMENNNLKQENIKLGSHKNKIFLCATYCGDEFAVLSTADGDLLTINGTELVSEMHGTAKAEKKKGKEKAKKGDEGSSINAIWHHESFVFTGEKNGEVSTYHVERNGKLNLIPAAQFHIWGYSASSLSMGDPWAEGRERPKDRAPAIRSLCVSANGKKLIVGTQTCEILEFELPDLHQKPTVGKALLAGHFQNEVWGVAVRPNPPGSKDGDSVQYATVGDDGYLRIWDLKEKAQIQCVKLGGMARACCFSSDGSFLAIGFGGRVGNKNGKNKEDGMVRVYRVEGDGTLTQVAEIKEAKQWISVVKFSPDSSLLAVGSRDNSIYIYSVTQQYNRKAKFSKHNAGIATMDFTADGKYLQSCCSGYEILFSDPLTGKQVTDGATKCFDAKWSSFTCTLGWPVIGIWSGTMDGSDINAVDRSPSGSLIATADDFGKVNVFRYPAIKEGGNVHATYTGHSSHVTGVQWISVPRGNKKVVSDDYLISIGGEDKCVFQWRNCNSDGDRLKGNISSESAESYGEAAGESKSEDNDFEPPGGGDEFTAVKPWLGAIKQPTAWDTPADTTKSNPYYAALGEFSNKHRALDGSPEAYNAARTSAANVLSKMQESGVDSHAAPDTDELELDWVHGYRGFDSRNNVFYADLSGKRVIIYFAAALGIVLDPTKRKQTYFRGHDDDIMSMAVHHPSDDKKICIVATGQQAASSTFVWEVPSMKTLAVLKTKQKSINQIEFSGDGRLLVMIAEDKSVVVSDWKSQTVLCNTKGEPAVTEKLAVVRDGPSTNLKFLSVGNKHMKYWTLSGRNLAATKVLTGKIGTIQNYLCIEEYQGSFYVGCEDGFIYVIPPDAKAVKEKFDHHVNAAQTIPKDMIAKELGKNRKNGSITAMYIDVTKQLLFTGCKRGSVVCWNISGSPTAQFAFNVADLAQNIVAKYIHSLCMIERGPDMLLVIGTRGCDILEVKCNINGDVSLFHDEAVSRHDAGVLIRSHCNDELWGIDTHPTEPIFCSVGDDKQLRIFHAKTRSMLTSVSLGNMSRAVAYSPDGTKLAVGFGGRVGRGKEAGGGVVRLYSHDCSDLTDIKVEKLAEKKDAKQWISDVKFTPDNSSIAVGAHDCKIYIYDIKVEGKGAVLNLRTTFSKHNSVINHLDISIDGRFMQSNCSAYELLFCDMATGKQITSATELRDVNWSTWSCTFGWPVQGIWATGADGSDINAVARSHSGHLVATSDDFGKLNVFRYPCVKPGAECIAYSGHSSHVMNVRWTVADEYVLTCGGNDKCIMQWKHSMGDSSSGDHSEGAAAADARGDGPEPESAAADDFGGGGEDFGVPGGGDEAGAVKPWLGAIRAPKVSPPLSAQAPAAELSLKWVHGYTCGTGAGNTKISKNLFYNVDKNVVFPAAALGVLLSRAEPGAAVPFTQQYFEGHDDDVLCMAISDDRRFIATGQTASKKTKGKGSVIIWDAVQCRVLSRMDGCHQRGVPSLAFSPDGAQLLSVGMDDNNTHNLWADMGGGWSRSELACSLKGDKKPVLFSQWVNPENPQAKNNEYHFLTGGASGLNFWKVEGSTLSKKQGRFNKKYKQCPMLCGANINTKDGWRVVAGTSTGDLYVFEEREANNAVEKAHNGPVICLAEGGKECLFLVSGGRDKRIQVWNNALQPVSSFDMKTSNDPTVASLDVKPFEADNTGAERPMVILAGTYGGDIVEITSKVDAQSSSSAGKTPDGIGLQKDLTSANMEVMLHAHFKGELWGLATHPSNPDILATCGDDGTLRVWSIQRCKELECVDLGWPARSVAWHPTGMALAVGFHEKVKGGLKAGKGKGKAKKNTTEKDDVAPHVGSIHVYSVFMPDDNQCVLTKRAQGCKSVAWIGDIKFNNEGNILAAGSHDKHMYAYNVPSQINISDVQNKGEWEDWNKSLGGKPKFDFNKHSSAVLHFDFSLDGKYWQSNCQASELLFGHADTGQQETSATKLADYNGQLDDNPEHEGQVWGTQTCTLGWPVQGIWPPGADMSDINAVDRHVGGKLMATADDMGQVKLFRYPCVSEGSKFSAYDGHSSHVTCVRWSIGNNLVSVGGNDRCVFVWELSEK